MENRYADEFSCGSSSRLPPQHPGRRRRCPLRLDAGPQESPRSARPYPDEIAFSHGHDLIWSRLCQLDVPALDVSPPLFFKEEPPGWVPFLNSTGAVVPCSAGGSPPPTVTWRKADSGAPVTELPGLRQLRPDGSLVFPPFGVDQYRPDVHATSYRCEASNSFGIIGSRDVRVTAGT
ncbi:hypothetical protein HPB51_011506 [Rhipicephalus microplus]|uniref:Ig-like domain-containing protein n=1 Tax=Rhipicephalus microplus TaxID=6941 RepID=A0A9J6D9K3_RHIMP|nr:hypothetical protein HPB51_011506 [Rhipicephalus microplus]